MKMNMMHIEKPPEGGWGRKERPIISAWRRPRGSAGEIFFDYPDDQFLQRNFFVHRAVPHLRHYFLRDTAQKIIFQIPQRLGLGAEFGRSGSFLRRGP